MKVEEIIVGRTYRVKMDKKFVALKVKSIDKTQTPRVTFECIDGMKKLHTIRSAASFIEEMMQTPEPGDHVQIVRGVDKDTLAAKMTYRVIRTEGMSVVLASGKKELTVAITDLRVVSADRTDEQKERDQKIIRIVSKSKGDKKDKQDLKETLELLSDKELNNIYSEIVLSGQSEDVPPSQLGRSFVPAEDGGTGPSKGLAGHIEGEQSLSPTIPSDHSTSGTTPTTQAIEPDEEPSLEYVCPICGWSGFYYADDVDDSPPFCQYDTCEYPTMVLKDRLQSWYESAMLMGFSSDNPPPEGWVPGTPVTEAKKLNAEGVSVSHPTPVSSVGNDVISPSVQTSVSSGTTSPEKEYEVKLVVGKIIRVSARSQSHADDLATADGYAVLRNGDKIAIPSKASTGKSKVGDRLRQNKLEEVKDTAPHVIVVARAGTGKTWTLVEGIKKVLGLPVAGTPSPQQAEVWRYMEMSKGKAKSICFCAFGNAIAAELKSKVPPGVAAMTCHSMGFRTVTSAFGKVEVEDNRTHNIIAELLGRDYREMRAREYDFLCSVSSLVNLCKYNLTGYERGQDTFGISIDDLDELVQHYGIEIQDQDRVYDLIGPVLKRSLDVKKDAMISFADMIWLPVVLDLPLTKYDLLLVDEAQDLNRCQQEIALRVGKRLILCGDNKQAIFGFAGADCESMDRMYKLLGNPCLKCGVVPSDSKFGIECGCGFGQSEVKCVKLPLTVTRRCGKAIVKEAQQLVPDFEAFVDNPEGSIGRMRYDKPKGGVATNPEGPQCYRDVVADGDFILCRVNAPLVSQCFRFLKEGRKATIRGRSIGDGLKELIKKFNATDVADLILKLCDWHNDEIRKENSKRFPSEERLIALSDKYQCLIAFTEGLTQVFEVLGKIDSIFVDDAKEGVILSSIHKAKGLESRRVFFLTIKGAECPHPMASSPWQVEQEWNLRYVAITRAKEELIYVS